MCPKKRFLKGSISVSHLNLSPDEKNNVIIVVPYRDREEHLKVFLEEIPKHFAKFHPDIGFKIVVVEQVDDNKFNRAKLLNIGFDLHKNEDAYFCFHDVDLIPENVSCDYSYPEIPIHLSAHCQQLEYKLDHGHIFGGVVLFDKFDFWNINGYSNEYWGWGAEDDDLLLRVMYAQSVGHLSGWGRRNGRYASLPHEHDGQCSSANWNRYKGKLKYDWKNEGINSLDYQLIETVEHEKYTHHKVIVKKQALKDQVCIKIVGNYYPYNLTEYFSRMCKDTKQKTWNKIKLVDEDEDKYIIINHSDDMIDTSKAIVFQMEPSSSIAKFPSPYHNIHRFRKDFQFVYDTKTYRNNIEWHISPTYSQLINDEIDLNKTKTFSTVMSARRNLIGQSQRLNFLIFLVDNLEIDVWGEGHSNDWINKDSPSAGREKGPLPFREKDLGLFPYKYTYAAENTKEKNYFTEKICDAILSECLCFYHGCPNLHDFLHPKSYISIDVCDHEQSLEIIKSAIADNEWEKRLPYIRESKNKILNELQMLPTLERIIHEKNYIL